MKLSLASSSLCLFSLCFFVKNSDAFQSPIIGIVQQRSGDSDSDGTGTIAQGRTTTIRRSMIAPLSAAPKRLDGNVDGVLFVNDHVSV
mmetsp:Transcript_25419/g.36178  ORF Transcript_25419/g.36178 Transcript_25419/m.36178 type:complete len:88 (-) Transcript_25419:188-451(-)